MDRFLGSHGEEEGPETPARGGEGASRQQLSGGEE